MAPPTGAPHAGQPLRGLTDDQLSDFATGRVEFRNRETPDSGLGPIFNDVSCFACHSGPAAGGASNITVTRFGTITDGAFDPLSDLGGSLLQKKAIAPNLREIVPPEATIVAHRQTTSLWGLGLMEAIPDSELIALASQPSVDGVAGRAAMIVDVVSGETHVGRFGWKNQHSSILGFAADAYANEMGITNRFFPEQNAPNGNQALLDSLNLPPGIEDTIDPTTGKADIDLVADFMRLLAPLPTQPLSTPAVAGQSLFHQVGCAVCHVPTLTTGPSDIAAIANKTVPLYSDLLLHDMGTLGDGIAQGAATGTEFRTAPLWGLRASAPYLHDGRAPDVDKAIRLHEGQGSVARDRYLQLTPQQQKQLLEFLNTL